MVVQPKRPFLCAGSANPKRRLTAIRTQRRYLRSYGTRRRATVGLAGACAAVARCAAAALDSLNGSLCDAGLAGCACRTAAALLSASMVSVPPHRTATVDRGRLVGATTLERDDGVCLFVCVGARTLWKRSGQRAAASMQRTMHDATCAVPAGCTPHAAASVQQRRPSPQAP